MFRQKGKLRWGKLVRLVSVVFLVACGFIALVALGQSSVSHGQGGTLQIVNVQANPVTVGRFEKFELTFGITATAASNLDWPYDPDPPPGLPAGTGISVDGLFSPDNWTTVYTQPAFLYQPYTYTVRNGQDHLYPAGEPEWKIRFAPPLTGTWRYRAQATDAAGMTIYPTTGDLTFTVASSGNLGFLHVSPTDPRYFEFDTGAPFVGVGHAEGFENTQLVQEATQKFTLFSANRANFFRVWMSGTPIFSSAWWPWTSHHLDYDGYIPPTSLTIEEAYADGDVSMKLWADNPCMFQGFTGQIPVLPERGYRVRVRVKTTNVTGPSQAGEPYGFVVKLGGWLGQDCSSASAGTPVTPYVTDTGGTWQIVTGTLTTNSGQYFLDNLYLTLSNVTGGAAYVDEVWLEEDLGGGRYGPNLVRKPRVNAHAYFDSFPAWQWDAILDEAAAEGIYLKLVVLEKNEWIFNRITASGTMTTIASNNNFYAAPDTKVRWLHEAWWRYLTARWSYSTAVHSWELLNEGNPYDDNHYNQAQSFAQYTHEHDPNRHMVTTSNWHSFPVKEFWGNPAYYDLDYADLHAYVSTGWGEYPLWGNGPPWPLAFEDNLAHVRGGVGHSLRIFGSESVHNATVPPGNLTIRGRGEWIIRFWMKADGMVGECNPDADALAGIRLFWILDQYQPDERKNVVPPAASGDPYRCSSPAGTYDWTQFRSDQTANGDAVPESVRIIIEDDQTHTLYVAVQNSFGTGGTAWLDDIEIVAPDGTVLATNGSIDLDSMHDDAALYTSAYSRLWGGGSPAGAWKPLVRGEAGLDHPEGPQEELDGLAQDTEGVWLHNFVWGGINPGGMYDLYWWPDNIRDHDLYHHYEPFRNFMDGIPLSNGHYEDARAVAPEGLQAWGQADRTNHRGHLWVQNTEHTWRNVVDGVSPTGWGGTIVVPDVLSGTYRLVWWDTWNGVSVLTQTVDRPFSWLSLALPYPITDDIAVQWERLGSASGEVTRVYLPVILRGYDL